MAKKEFTNLNTDLAALASTMPVQRAPHVIAELMQLEAYIHDLKARVDRLEASEKGSRSDGNAPMRERYLERE